MKNKFLLFYRFTLLVLMFCMLSSINVKAQNIITLGTGTNVKSSTEGQTPYGCYFTTNRSQYLILASEIKALGVEGAALLDAIEFSVQSAGSGSASSNNSCGLSNGQLMNYTISLKNTAVTQLSSFDFSGLTQVYSTTLFTPAAGWNKHSFSNSFQWDGVSNILVNICSFNDNSPSTCGNYCWLSDATVYYTTTSFASSIYAWNDNVGSYCTSSNTSSCGSTTFSASTAYSTQRANMRLTFKPGTPPVPPIPGFAFDLSTDTLWQGSPSTILNTSAYASKNYWDITGYNATSSTGPWTPVSVTRQPNAWGSFIDTLNNDPNFHYVFPQTGYYRVKLVTVNPYGNTYMEKAVLIAAPYSKPKANFFADKRTLGVNDQVRLFDNSKNAPGFWKWWTVPLCTNCGGNWNIWNTDSDVNPRIIAWDPGVYTVCQAVSNIKGVDTFCRENYITILPGYVMCNGPDTVSKQSAGYLYPKRVNHDVLNTFTATSCSATSGFRITPCADTIKTRIDQLRLRDQDSLFIRLGSFTGPKLRAYGGNNINKYHDSLKVLNFATQQVFVTFEPGSPSGGEISDSGFVLKWTSAPAAYSTPTALFTSPDVVYSAYKVMLQNQSSGSNMVYAWDLNGDGIYGLDSPNVAIDSTSQNASITYNTAVQTTKTICLRTSNCMGSDTYCKTFSVLPVTQVPQADFTVNRTNGLLSDTFVFTDISKFGANSWQWSFEPNNVTYINGTNANSQNPMVLLNAPQTYNVKLVATNSFGSNELKKNAYVSGTDYPSPNSDYPVTSAATDIGISRVVLQGTNSGIDNTTSSQTPTYSTFVNVYGASLYRGKTYTVDVYRPSAVNPENTRIWIDFNRNTSYMDANETILAEDSQYKVKTSQTFTVPVNANIGSTRMLIGVSTDYATLTPISSTLGVYEDYTINIALDQVKPVVQLIGGDTVKTDINKLYSDSGATATDNLEDDIASRIQMAGRELIDTSKTGYYILKYYVVDYYGNVSDTAYRVVQVDILASHPIVTITGNDTVQSEVNTWYTDLGATAVDYAGNILPVNTTTNLDTTQLGDYTFNYSATDAFNHTTTVHRVIQVRDTQIPVINSKSGDTLVYHQIYTPFDDNDYIRVTDNYWNSITPKRSGSLNVNSKGVYALTYNAVDGSGNVANEYRLYVSVTNLIMPTMAMLGLPEMTVSVYTDFTDPGATAKDYTGKSLPVTVDKGGLNTNVIGDYTVTYTAKDEFLNEVSKQRTVKVRDLEAPEIKLFGDNPFYNGLGEAYVEPGFKVNDNYDKNLESKVIYDPTVVKVNNPNKTYVIYYNVTDSSGNKALEKKRYVIIKPTGVEDLLQNSEYAIYPNPASKVLNVELKKNGTSVKDMKVYDIQGRLKSEVTIDKHADSYTLNISSLADGLYLLKIDTGDNKSATVKFIVSK